MTKLRIVLFGALLLSSSNALAQKAKYTRSQDVKIDVKLSDRTKAIVPKAADPKDVKPSLSSDQVLSIEGLIGNIQGEQEVILVDLIKTTPDSEVEEKSEYYFRLGELYAKQQRYWRLKSVELQIAADAAKTPAAKQKAIADAKVGQDKAKSFLLKAVKTYASLTDNDAFRNYAKMDMALFYYGYTLTGGKYMKEARAVYDKLLKNYPNSKYVPEAHLAFADYYFEAGQLADAEARYKQVLKFPKSSAYYYAMYKMGWIDLNLQKYQEALETFFQVAQNTKDKKQEVLNRSAKKDFVRAYAEIGKADKAYAAFQRVDNKFAFDMLQILADLYLDQGKSDRAIYTYQELMKTAPKDKNVCLWQYNISHAMLSMPGAGNADKVDEIGKLVRLYGALRANKTLPQAESQECHDNAAAMSGELARAYHSESSKTKNPETLAYAEKLYKVYLEVFPDAEDFADTQYFYAELQWSRAENEKNARLQTALWEDAAVAFTDVVKTQKADPKKLKEAAYAAVLGWKNALNVDPRLKEQVGEIDDDKSYDTVPPAKPIPPREQKMLDAFDIYIKYIKDPKDPDLVLMKFSKANTLRKYNHFDEAIPMFEDILQNHRDAEAAEYSAQLLLDTYNRMQKYDEMLVLVDKLEADKKFLDGKVTLAETMAKIKAQSMRKQAEQLEKVADQTKDNSKYIACGQAYMGIYNRDPELKENDQVLYNAGVCFQKGKSIGAAILAYNALQKYFPNSKITAKGIALLGKAYGDVAFYDKASDKYEEYAKKYAGEDNAYDVMNDAVFYRKGLGDDQKAIEDTRYFVSRFGSSKPKEAAMAQYSLVTVYEKQGDGDAVVKHLRDYIKRYGSAKGGDARLVMAYAKIGQTLWAASCPTKLTDGSCVKITRERAINVKKLKHRKGMEQPLQCGPDSKIKLTVVPRDEKKVKEAMAAFSTAVKEYDKRQGKIEEDAPLARFFYAQSKLGLADRDFETYLTLKFPSGLNFDPNNKSVAEKSKKRFDEWVVQKQKAGGTAQVQYTNILTVKDNATSIAAAARIAQISQNLSDALFTAEIPANVRTGPFADDAVEAFCDTMSNVAEPLDTRALEGFTACLEESTKRGWFSEWSKMCERELGQIKPEEYPTASELRGTPDQVAPVSDVEDPILKLE